jgi:hypothetical protein
MTIAAIKAIELNIAGLVFFIISWRNAYVEMENTTPKGNGAKMNLIGENISWPSS